MKYVCFEIELDWTKAAAQRLGMAIMNDKVRVRRAASSGGSTTLLVDVLACAYKNTLEELRPASAQYKSPTTFDRGTIHPVFVSPEDEMDELQCPKHLRRQARYERPQLKDSVWMRVARAQADLSTCLRRQVGCVLLREDGSVAGTGYNGALPGDPHCTPERCNASKRCLNTRHAERSALDYSVGVVVTAYVTDEPCLRCTLDLAARGVKRVVFGRAYTAAEEVEERTRFVQRRGLLWEHRPDLFEAEVT